MAKRFNTADKYTERYRGQLHPCKYCGSTDIRIASDRTIFGGSKNVWSVVCSTPHCDCTGEYSSVKKAIEVWNTKH